MQPAGKDSVNNGSSVLAAAAAEMQADGLDG
jgi:hypothetical protein